MCARSCIYCIMHTQAGFKLCLALAARVCTCTRGFPQVGSLCLRSKFVQLIQIGCLQLDGTVDGTCAGIPEHTDVGVPVHTGTGIYGLRSILGK